MFRSGRALDGSVESVSYGLWLDRIIVEQRTLNPGGIRLVGLLRRQQFRIMNILHQLQRRSQNYDSVCAEKNYTIQQGESFAMAEARIIIIGTD